MEKLENVACWSFSDDIKEGIYECDMETEKKFKIRVHANRVVINGDSSHSTKLTLKQVGASANINYCFYLYLEKEKPYYPLFVCSDNLEDMGEWENSIDSDVDIYIGIPFTIRRYGYTEKDLENLKVFKNL